MDLTVDKGAILADWRARRRQRARILLEYDETVAAQMALVHQVRAVVTRLNEQVQADRKLPRFNGDDAVLTARGPSLFVRFGSPGALQAFLDGLVDGLAALRGTGRLTSGGERDPGPMPTGPLIGLFGVLAVSGWENFRDRKARAAWLLSPELAPAIAALAESWLSRIDGDITIPMGSADVVPEDRLVTMTEAILADVEGPALSSVNRTGEKLARRVYLSRRGDILLFARVLPDQVDDTFQQLVDLLREWAPRCDFTVITPGEFGGAAEILHLLARARRTRPLGYYVSSRDLDREYLPDAFVWQTVTKTHLDKITDLDRWRVTQLDEDCFEVAATDPSPWLLTDDDHRPGGVADDTLAVAREDFGPLILASEN